jgi:hypothetical protein
MQERAFREIALTVDDEFAAKFELFYNDNHDCRFWIFQMPLVLKLMNGSRIFWIFRSNSSRSKEKTE